MSGNAGSVRCQSCGMINWAGEPACKRCGRALTGDAEEVSGFGVWSPPPAAAHAPRRAQSAGRRSGGSFGKLIVGVILVMALAGTYYNGLPDYLRGGPRWRDFTLPPANFSVRMPTEPSVVLEPLVAEGEIPWRRASAELWGKEACYVNFTDIPFLQQMTDKQLEKMAMDVAKSTDSVVLARRSVGIDGSSRGLEFEMKTPDRLMADGRAYCRIYIVGARLYTLMLVGHENGRLVRERNEFFDSFKVLRKNIERDFSEATDDAR